MDRNSFCSICSRIQTVALRKESVDRNTTEQITKMIATRVALRKESVDRNFTDFKLFIRHWVALRKESVDRNGSDAEESE